MYVQFHTDEKHKYIYEGPVMEFDRCLVERWRAETIAPSERKAKSNFAYQFKKQNNRIDGARITLPGKIFMVS